MPLTWDQFSNTKAYKGLNRQDRVTAKLGFFKQVMQDSPEWADLTEDQRLKVTQNFFADEISVQPERTAAGTLKDIGISAAKGVVGTGEAAIGLLDIPTFGLAGKGFEAIGGSFPETYKILESGYSPAQQYANKKVSEAEGFFDTAGTMLKYPSTIGHAVVESAPSVLGGGAVARGAIGLVPKLAPLVAGAIGEGVISAGQTAEQARQASDTGLIGPKEIGASVASGAITGAIALAGGRIAKKFGFADPDTMLASGRLGTTQGSVARRIIEGGISEGVFEELPQSMQEQVWANAATGRPLMQGVPQAGAQGMFAGAAMGAGANVIARPPERESRLNMLRAPNIETVKKIEPESELTPLNIETVRPDQFEFPAQTEEEQAQMQRDIEIQRKPEYRTRVRNQAAIINADQAQQAQEQAQEREFRLRRAAQSSEQQRLEQNQQQIEATNIEAENEIARNRFNALEDLYDLAHDAGRRGERIPRSTSRFIGRLTTEERQKLNDYYESGKHVADVLKRNEIDEDQEDAEGIFREQEPSGEEIPQGRDDPGGGIEEGEAQRSDKLLVRPSQGGEQVGLESSGPSPAAPIQKEPSNIKALEDQVKLKQAELEKQYDETKKGTRAQKEFATSRYNFLKKDLESWKGALEDAKADLTQGQQEIPKAPSPLEKQPKPAITEPMTSKSGAGDITTKITPEGPKGGKIYTDALGFPEPNAIISYFGPIYPTEIKKYSKEKGSYTEIEKGFWTISTSSDAIFDNNRFETIKDAIEEAKSKGFDVKELSKDGHGKEKASLIHQDTKKELDKIKFKSENQWKSGKDVFVRYGDLPKSGKSYDNQTGRYEKGVSVFRGRITPDGVILVRPSNHVDTMTFHALSNSDRKIYIVDGNEIGTGADGEPLLENVKKITVKQALRKLFTQKEINAYGSPEQVGKHIDKTTQYEQKLAEYTQERKKAISEGTPESEIREAEGTVRRTVAPESATAPELPSKSESRKAIGRAWTGNQWKPITEQIEIKRGKNKGKMRVTFAGGRKRVVASESIKLFETTPAVSTQGAEPAQVKRGATPMATEPQRTEQALATIINPDGRNYRTDGTTSEINGKQVGVWEYQYAGKWIPVKNIQKRIEADKILKSNKKVRDIKRILKDQTGSSQLATDIINHGITLKEKGIESFRNFRAAMHQKFLDIWEKIKGHMRALWSILNNQRGEITIERTKKEIPQKETEVFKEGEVFNKEPKQQIESDQLTTIETLKGFLQKPKLTQKAKNDLSYIGDLLLGLPSFFAEKIPAVKKIFDASQSRQDEFHEGINWMENHDNANVIEQWKRLKGSDRDQASKYLVQNDRDMTGFRVAQRKSGKWVAMDREGRKIAEFESELTEDMIDKGEVAAVEKIVQAETEYLNSRGFSPEQVAAIISFRLSTNKGFDTLFASMRKLIRTYKENNIPLPKIPVTENEKTVHIDLEQAMARMNDIRGYYFPRIRKPGKYILRAFKKGQYNILETFSFARRMNVRRLELEKQGYTVDTGENTQLGEDVFEMAGKLVATQQIVNAALDNVSKGIKASSKEEIDSLEKEVESIFASALAEQIANVIRERGSRVHMTRRSPQVYIGYEEDPETVIAKYIRGISAGEAKRNMVMKMLRAFTGTDVSWKDFKTENPDATYDDYRDMVKENMIDQREQKTAFKWAKAYIAENTRNQEPADRAIGIVKGVAVAKYLAFRVFSAPLVNLTALPTSAVASMKAAGIPYVDTFRHLTSAARGYGRYRLGKTLSADQQRVFDYIRQKGWDNPQFNSEALTTLRGAVGRRYDKVIEYGMWTFSESERLNRAATIAGAYNGLAKMKTGEDFEALMDKAKKISDDSHGIYNRGNYPYIALGRHPAALVTKAFYVFRTFSHTYLNNLYRVGFKENDKIALAHMLIAPAVIAGAGASVLTPLISIILKALGIDEPEEQAYLKIGEMFGPSAENVARFGVTAAIPGGGLSMKGSLSIGITDIPTELRVKDFLGAPGSVIDEIFHIAPAAIFRGDVAKGVEKLLPTGFGNMIRAYREGTEGITTRNNAPVFFGDEQMKLNLVESIYRGMSFNPARIAGMREKQYRERMVEEKYRQRKTDIYAKIKRYILEGSRDPEKWAELIGEVEQFNEDAGRWRISPITRRSIKTNLKRSFKPSRKERMRQ